MSTTNVKVIQEANPKRESDYYRKTDNVPFLRIVDDISKRIVLKHLGIRSEQKDGKKEALAASMILRNAILGSIPQSDTVTKLNHIQIWYLSGIITNGITVTDGENQEIKFVMNEDSLLHIKAYLGVINTDPGFLVDGWSICIPKK